MRRSCLFFLLGSAVCLGATSEAIHKQFKGAVMARDYKGIEQCWEELKAVATDEEIEAYAASVIMQVEHDAGPIAERLARVNKLHELSLPPSASDYFQEAERTYCFRLWRDNANLVELRELLRHPVPALENLIAIKANPAAFIKVKKSEWYLLSGDYSWEVLRRRAISLVISEQLKGREIAWNTSLGSLGLKKPDEVGEPEWKTVAVWELVRRQMPVLPPDDEAYAARSVPALKADLDKSDFGKLLGQLLDAWVAERKHINSLVSALEGKLYAVDQLDASDPYQAVCLRLLAFKLAETTPDWMQIPEEVRNLDWFKEVDSSVVDLWKGLLTDTQVKILDLYGGKQTVQYWHVLHQVPQGIEGAERLWTYYAKTHDDLFLLYFVENLCAVDLKRANPKAERLRKTFDDSGLLKKALELDLGLKGSPRLYGNSGNVERFIESGPNCAFDINLLNWFSSTWTLHRLAQLREGNSNSLLCMLYLEDQGESLKAEILRDPKEGAADCEKVIEKARNTEIVPYRLASETEEKIRGYIKEAREAQDKTAQ